MVVQVQGGEVLVGGELEERIPGGIAVILLLIL